ETGFFFLPGSSFPDLLPHPHPHTPRSHQFLPQFLPADPAATPAAGHPVAAPDAAPRPPAALPPVFIGIFFDFFYPRFHVAHECDPEQFPPLPPLLTPAPARRGPSTSPTLAIPLAPAHARSWFLPCEAPVDARRRSVAAAPRQIQILRRLPRRQRDRTSCRRTRGSPRTMRSWSGTGMTSLTAAC
ncbi:unnamed protein product, partial [Urochloa humidicola]